VSELYNEVSCFQSAYVRFKTWISAEAVAMETRVETGSNTSTVTLRVVGGDESGSLKSETVKYGRESQRTRTRGKLRWQGPAACTKDRPLLTSERAPHKKEQGRNYQTVLNIWS
jgi:hypothetical protein